MAARGRAAVLVIAILLFVPSKSEDIRSKVDLHEDVDNVLLSIENLLGYYQADLKNLNLDGFFGLRVLEGHLLLILEDIEGGKLHNLSENILLNIKKLAKTAAIVSAEGLDYVRKDNPKYFDDFSPIVRKPWSVFKHQRKLEPSLRWEIPQYKAKVKTHLSEKLSDKCLKQLMGSNSSDCVISEECVKIMTTRGLTGYGITHQLLWSILGEISVKCNNSLHLMLKKHGIESIDSFQQELCTNNFYEMVAVVHVLMKGQIHESHQDLFLEQQFVCPSLGFYEFIKKDYLDQILSWQFPSGCFGEDDDDDADDGDDAANDDDIDVANLLESYHNKNQVNGVSIEEKENINQGDPIHDGVQLGNGLKSGNEQNFEREVKPLRFKIGNKENDVADSPSQMGVKMSLLSKSKQNSLDFKSKNTDVHYRKPFDSDANPSQAGHKRSKIGLPAKLFVGEGNPQESLNVKEKADPHHPNLSRPLDGGVGAQGTGRRGRKLLVEKRLNGGCLSHKTGVGAGALVVYLRFLIQPGAIQWTGPHELFQLERNNLPKKEPTELVDDDGGPVDDEEDEDDDLKKDEYEDDYAKHYEDADSKENGKEGGGGLLAQSKHDKLKLDIKEKHDDLNDNNNRNSLKAHGVSDLNLQSNTLSKSNGDVDDDHVYNDEEGAEGSKRGAKNRFPLPPKERIGVNVLKRRRRPKIHKDSSSNFIYAHVGGEIATSSHPSMFLVVLVSVLPIFIITFFLFKFVRCHRILALFHRS